MNYQETLKRYDDLVAQCNRFERKGKTMPYTSSNGHMFSFINKAGEFGIRFGKERQEELMKELNSDYFHSHNAIMKGYVLIPEIVFNNNKTMIDLLNESYEYVESLPSK